MKIKEARNNKQNDKRRKKKSIQRFYEKKAININK